MIVVCSTFGLISPLAANAAATFPVDSAGIAAYVKLNQLSAVNFENAKSLFDRVETLGTTYMIGVKDYRASEIGIANSAVPVRVYLGADGWLVAYLSRGQEPSRIVNWNDGQPLGNTILKIAIDEAAAKIGSAIVEPMKYYDFAHPDANKMTFAKQNLDNPAINSKTINILVPGTLHQASYSIKNYAPSGAPYGVKAVLYLNNVLVALFEPSAFQYGIYENPPFNQGSNNDVKLERGSGIGYVSAVTALIYKTN